MNFTKRPLVVVSLLFGVALIVHTGSSSARDSENGFYNLAGAQGGKQKCINTCRARYRDCRRLGQLSTFECQSVYRDCTQYSCNGRGPG